MKPLSLIIGVIALLGLVGFATYNFGNFVGEANADACYTDSLDLIKTYAQKADSAQVVELIGSLALSGYETRCPDVVKAVENYTRAHGPNREP